MERQNRAQKLANAIRASIDSYPGGLCFASADGRPILVNKRMNELVSWLTGHTVLDARAAWEELSNAPLPPDCRRLDQPWLPRDAEDGDHRQLFFALPDGTVWQFHRQLLTDEEPPTVQIEATEMTELFSLSQELYENNLRLLELQCRQRALLENIVQINREKELLSASSASTMSWAAACWPQNGFSLSRETSGRRSKSDRRGKRPSGISPTFPSQAGGRTSPPRLSCWRWPG